MALHRVIGPRPVFELQPGAQFERELSAGEQHLLGVHIEAVEAEPDTKKRTSAPDTNEETESEE